MRAATVRTFALSLPEAEERETWGDATFRVRNKIFSMFDEQERHLWIKSTHDEQRALIAMNPDAFFVPSYVGSKGWIGVVGGFRRHDPTEVQLISMWVDPRARGTGAARALIRAVATWGDDVGARRVVLFVQEVNTPGQALYLKAGFHPTGDRMPVGIGRRGFKLVFAASVGDLLAA